MHRDSIAWVLNLRGSDVPFNPVFFAYLVITLDEVVLFIDAPKLDSDVRAHVDELGVTTKGYNDIWAYLRKGKFRGKVSVSRDLPRVANTQYLYSRCFLILKSPMLLQSCLRPLASLSSITLMSPS